MAHARLKRRIESPDVPSDLAWLLAGLLGTAVLGIGIAWYPWLAAVAVLPIAGLAMSSSALVRFSFFTFGGLVILQSSSGFDLPKIAYFGGCAVAFGFAFVRTQGLTDPALRPLRHASILLSLAWAGLVLISFPVAMSNNAAPMDWLRDAIPYMLVAAVPYLAMDVLADLRHDPASPMPARLFVLFGLLTSFGFFANWVTKRGFADIGLEGIFFSTFAVPAAVFSYAVANATSAKLHRPFWTGLATLILAMILLTGTRSSLILLAAPLAIVLGQGSLIRQAPRIVATGLTVAIVGAALYLTLPDTFGIDPGMIFERFLSIGDLTSDTVAGQSFNEREAVTTLTWEAVKQAPILGFGPGHLYEWSVPYRTELASSYTLDSPLSVPAKFGLLGFGVYLCTLGGLFAFQRHLARLGPRLAVERDAIRGFLAITVFLSLLGSPIDDKGFSFALAFLLIIGGQGILRVESEKRAHATVGLDPDPLLQPGSVAA